MKSVVNQLCHQVEFLNEDVTSADELLSININSILLPNYLKNPKSICETKNFRYIVNKFKPYFLIHFSNIEKSQLFYSKIDNLITANNLSANVFVVCVNNKNAVEPKEKATIGKIQTNANKKH
ncbi:MAG: hypothetical protein IPP81_12780 [Chitinophagaceae bacterium]|nr:hypothetical protein [Chitinophagaceae bacterium]